jgi:hypothetical protein
MTLYLILISIHIVIAVIGMGQSAAVAFLTLGRDASGPPSLLLRLLRAGSWSLALMFVSGIALVWESGGVYVNTWWLRISVILFFFLGFLHGQARRILKHATDDAVPAESRRPLFIISCAMLISIAVLAILMETKPW